MTFVVFLAVFSPLAQAHPGVPVVLEPEAGLPRPGPSETPEPSPSPSTTPTPGGEETPAPEPSETAAPITLISPSRGHLTSASEVPAVSDRYDGDDQAVHVAAFTPDPPPNTLVEASIETVPSGPLATLGGSRAEHTLGLLDPVPETPGLWRADVPLPNIEDGRTEVIVRLFEWTPEGFIEHGEDRLTVDVERRPADPPDDLAAPAAVVNLTWPDQGGGLGFHRAIKPRELLDLTQTSQSVWSTVIDGTASEDASVTLMYSTTSLTSPLQFKECGFASPTFRGDGSIEFSSRCDLIGADRPSMVTAVAAVARKASDVPVESVARRVADVHLVTPYLQDARKMTLSIDPVSASRASPGSCIEYRVGVVDDQDRPVPGANVDLHLSGPSDLVGFAVDNFGTAVRPSYVGAGDGPQEYHQAQARPVCGSSNVSTLAQGFHRVVAGPDEKHLEILTEGASGSVIVKIQSNDAGVTLLNGWIDEVVVVDDGAAVRPDDDLRGDLEPVTSTRVLWHGELPLLRLDVPTGSTEPGACVPVTAQMQVGRHPVSNTNIDVHMSGTGASFCDAPDASSRRAPDAGGHHETGDASAPHEDPDSPGHHTEGETDEHGIFTFGVTSSGGEEIALEAWSDGDRRTDVTAGDDDVLGPDEPHASTVLSLVGSVHDVRVRLLSPSSLGEALVSSLEDGRSPFELVASVDAPSLVEHVVFEYRGEDEEAFSDIGVASRVAQSDAYVLPWDTSTLESGTYRVRAGVPGTEAVDEVEVVVDNSRAVAKLTTPEMRGAALFAQGATTLGGIASPEATEVTFFYSVTPRGAGPPAWTPCGSATPTGAADADGSFSGECRLSGPHRAHQVTALGVVGNSQSCDPIGGCVPISHSSDVHRVVGGVARPNIVVEPAEAESAAGRCHRFTGAVTDEAGEPVPHEPVHVILEDDAGISSFCDPEGPGEEAEGQPTSEMSVSTDPAGRFVFGVSAGEPIDTHIRAWVDRTQDGVQGADEPSDTSLMHWILPRECTHTGTPGSDVISGTAGADRLCGGGGDDVLRGLGGPDRLFGGSGDDRLYGGEGDDLLFGGNGADLLHGGSGEDRCSPGRGEEDTRACEEPRRARGAV